MKDVLTRRQLSRATLARQVLLSREKMSALKAVERLAGMQSQLARPPYIGLWSRIDGFQREELTRLLADRKVIRATLMRGTLHLMSARDYLEFRPGLQPMLTQGALSVLGNRATDIDLKTVTAEARRFFDEEPRTFDELRAHLHQRFPKFEERAMAYMVRMHLPLVQVPTDAEWGFPGSADFASAESWLGKKIGKGAPLQKLALRYLAAFGPASPQDAQTWSGLRLREAFESLRPKLRAFRDERGRELFDLPGAPRPPEDTPAPVRFLPEFDNLLLAHADRTRVVADEHRRAIFTPNLFIPPVFLVDGFAAGTWKAESGKVAIKPFAPLQKRVRAEVDEEAHALSKFVA
jgi:hypothetical protein